MLMFYCENGTRKIFYVIKILLYLVELMTPVNVQDRVVQILQIGNFSLNVQEGMLVFNSVHRTSKILQGVNFSFNFVEVMSIINILSHREVHLLESVKALHDFTILVFSVDLVYGIVQGFQFCQVFLNLSKVVSSLNCVNWTLEDLQI